MDSRGTIPNDLPYSAVLMVTTVDFSDDPDEWIHEIEHYLCTGMILGKVEGDAWKKLALHFKYFSLVDGLVYYGSIAGVSRLVAHHHEIQAILANFQARIA